MATEARSAWLFDFGAGLRAVLHLALSPDGRLSGASGALSHHADPG